MKRLLAAALLLTLLLASASCAPAADQDELAELRDQVQTLRNEQSEMRARLDLLEGSQLSAPGDQVKVVAYFGLMTANDIFTVPVIRIVEAADDLKIAALQQLIAGPDPDGPLSPTAPPETQILSLTIENGVATVDFSDDIREHAAGSAGETMVVASIVNTLTEFPDVQKVQILVEGEEGASLGGHFSLDEPLERMGGMIP